MVPFSESLCKTFKLNANKKRVRYYPELEENNKTSIVFNNENEFKGNYEVIKNSNIIKLIFKPEFAFREFDRKILKSANINARNIYPDATGIAKSIEYW